MKLHELETELLKLEAADRGRLAAKLIASLDDTPDVQTQELWVKAALERDRDLDQDPARGRPASDVFREARARLA